MNYRQSSFFEDLRVKLVESIDFWIKMFLDPNQKLFLPTEKSRSFLVGFVSQSQNFPTSYFSLGTSDIFGGRSELILWNRETSNSKIIFKISEMLDSPDRRIVENYWFYDD